MPKFIFFDLDDTLFDDKKAKQDYLPRVYKSYGIQARVSYIDFKTNWFAGLNKYIPMYETGKITFYEQQAIRFSELTGISNPEKRTVQNFYDFITEQYEKSFCLFDDAIETLSKLKEQGHFLGVITNGVTEQQRKKISKFNLEPFFDTIIISQEVGFSKPQEGIFKFALNSIESSKNIPYYIGDDYEKDVVGSFNAGLNPVWINRGKIKTETLNNQVGLITQLSELVEYFT